MADNALRVLLVDDDQDDYTLTREMLADAGVGAVQLDWVSTYNAAVDAIALKCHDLYLIDYVLGVHNGIEVLRAARRCGCVAPMVLLTGMDSEALALEATGAGASAYVSKRRLNAIDLAQIARESRAARR